MQLSSCEHLFLDVAKGEFACINSTMPVHKADVSMDIRNFDEVLICHT